MSDGGGPQFAKVPRWVFQSENLTDRDLRVYTYLVWLASPTDECWPSLRAIGNGAPIVKFDEETGVSTVHRRSRRAVMYSIKRLEQFGAIRRMERPGRTTIYKVHQSPLNIVSVPQRTFDLPVDNSEMGG